MAQIINCTVPAGGTLNSQGSGAVDAGVNTVNHGIDPKYIDDENWFRATVVGVSGAIGALSVDKTSFTFTADAPGNVVVQCRQEHTITR